MLPAAAACAIFVPLIAFDLLKNSVFRNISMNIIPAQIALLLTIPWLNDRNVVRSEDRQNQEIFFKYISRLPGEILYSNDVVPRQFTGKNPYTEQVAVHGEIAIGDSIARS